VTSDEAETATEGAPATDGPRVEESPRKTPAGGERKSDTEPEDAKAGEPDGQTGQPETITDLLRSIEGGSQDGPDGRDE
jgi:hypothetical protein